MMQKAAWMPVGDKTKRDWQGFFPFFRADAPKSTAATEWGVFDNVVKPFGDFPAEHCFAMGKTTIVDARTHLPEGKNAWDIDRNGFCYVERPEYDFEEHDKQVSFPFATATTVTVSAQLAALDRFGVGMHDACNCMMLHHPPCSHSACRSSPAQLASGGLRIRHHRTAPAIRHH